MSNIKKLFVDNGIFEKSENNEGYILGEEFLPLVYSEIETQDCIINHVNNIKVNSKKIRTPVFEKIIFETDDEGNILCNSDIGAKITTKEGNLRTIDLRLCFGSSVFDMQGETLKRYVAKEIAQAMIDAIHFQLSKKLIDLGVGEEIIYSDEWFKTYCKSHVNNNSVIIMSSDMYGAVAEFNVTDDPKVMGRPTIFVKDKNWNGIIVVDKTVCSFLHNGNIEATILEGVGFTSNLSYFQSLLYCGWLITNSDHCYYAKFPTE